MSIGWWRDADAIFGTHTIGHTKGGFSWVGPCLFPRPIGITLGTGMVSQARICPNVAPSPDREPPRGQPGNVQRDANTERVRQSARLPDSGATCRTQRKTRATHSPEYRSVSAGVRSQSRPNTVASGVIKFTSRSRSLMAANRCSVPGPDRPGDARSPARAGARRSRGLSSSHSETATSGVSAPVGRERREGRQPRKEAFPLPNGADHRGCERPGHPADRVLAPHTPRACSWRCWCSRPTIARSWSS